MAEKTYVYRDPRWVLSTLKAMIAILVFGYVVEMALFIAAWAGGLNVFLMRGYFDIYTTYGIVVRIVSIVQVAGLIGTTISYLFWVYRVSANVHALGAEGLRANPGFAVGMYFIPLYNLVAPLPAMIEIYKASARATAWTLQRNGAITGVWWSLQIITLFGNAFETFAARDDYSGLRLLVIVMAGLNIAYHATQFMLADIVSKRQMAQQAQREDPAETFA